MSEDREFGPEDLDKPPSFFPYEEAATPDLEDRDFGDPIEVQVEAVFAAQAEAETVHYVLLSDGQRKLPISIGEYEAVSIDLALRGRKPNRPMTHDLLAIVIARMNGSIEKITIDDLWGGTYYAKVLIALAKEKVEIDARPSDAISLAVRTGSPIFVLEGILDQKQTEE